MMRRRIIFEQGQRGVSRLRRLTSGGFFGHNGGPPPFHRDHLLLWCFGPGRRHITSAFSYQPALSPPARLGRRISLQCPSTAVFNVESEEGETGIASPKGNSHSSGVNSARPPATADVDAVTAALAANVIGMVSRSTGCTTLTLRGC